MQFKFLFTGNKYDMKIVWKYMYKLFVLTLKFLFLYATLSQTNVFMFSKQLTQFIN